MSAMTTGYVPVARADEIPEGGVKVVRIEDQSIAVFRLGGEYYAIDDICTHDGGPLAEGIVEGDEIECPRHGARFNIKTGAVLTLPATAPVTTYSVRIENGEIQVRWDMSDVKPNPDPLVASTASDVPGPGAPARGVAEASAPQTAGDAAPPAGRVDTKPAPSQQEIAVRSALESVMDPEIGLSVIDLGLIREIHFLPDQTLVKMMLTTPFCPYAPQMVEDVKQATMSVVPKLCEVELMPDPWSPDMMPDPGLLGFSY
jgi:NAD(P)H-dependent nitrite reductase small subunit